MAGKLTIPALRRQAVLGSLPLPTTLARAISTAGFVQADPIRAPARAQDLILRHRVTGYRAGDLERRFARVGLEEDFLYAYGFMPRETHLLLHPRDPASSGRYQVPGQLAAEVLAFVRDRGPTHPVDLEERFGRERAVNGWGGFSKATTRVLQSLHYHGQLRVAGRRDGIRVYEAAMPHPDPLAPEKRSRRIALLVIGILAPLAEPGLAATFGLLGRGAPGLGGWRQTVTALLAAGELESGEVDGVRYLWPVGGAGRRGSPDSVRLLAPFDPIVWERRRFEHLWGWDYRFEAYTRPEQRRFGYYAMPLLWGYDIIGWANVSLKDGRLDADLGFVGARPRDPAFRRGLDAELAAMESFLT
ncbi:MAG TPA: crosslink repair DNA glycosylase YcaQ family protein [Acetobacteraceae bacterium]|nr:crosslink repair DNA glycosylase YcaQ family protein [Acetobacteraceae bacterium]